jgi:RimJ/RimL family protein N-acetyltransferase
MGQPESNRNALNVAGARLYAAHMTRHNEWGQPIGPELPGFNPPEPPPRSLLSGVYVELAPIDPERHGAELYAAHAGLPGSHWTYLPYGPFESGAGYRRWLEQYCLRDDPQFFTLVDKPSGKLAGLAAYLRIQRESACIEVGHLSFTPLLARRPGATEAMTLMMRRAFELGYRRYEWKCDALNAPSRAAAVRLGFHFEGIFRQATLYKGRSRDTAWYSVIDREWPEVERAHRTWLAPENFDASGVQRSRLSDLTREARASASLESTD